MDLNSLAIRISRSENLPMLPQAVSSILRLADDPNASQRDIEKAFECDAAITAKILRVANSAYYGGVNVPSIGRAISFLGMTTVRSLVVGVAFQQTVGTKAQAKNFDKLAFWRHSLCTAVSARLLGKLKQPAKAEELYCAGIMHDIGMLVMERFLATEFDQAIELSSKAMIPLHEAETKVLGYDHAAVGGMLAEKWELTGIMRAGIEHHHHPAADKDFREATMIVEQANKLAHFCGYSNQGCPIKVAPEAMAQALGLPVEQVPIIQQVITAEITKAEEGMQIAA